MKNILRKKLLYLVIFGSVLFCCYSSFASLISEQEQMKYINQIELFFNKIKSLQSRFIEVSSTKGVAVGRFFIMRPHMMKVEYESPHRNVIIADGKNLYHWDSQLKERSKYDITLSPIAAILSKRIDLKKNAVIKNIKQDSARIWISLDFPGHSGIGSIVLVFTKHPFCLSQWIIIDNQRGTTEVTLQNINHGARLTSADFNVN